jgi:hypothetical protein
MIENDHNKYRRFAEEAQSRADRALNDRDKASWLKIARSWLEMLPGRTRTAEEQFDDKARDLGTGQEESDTRN